MKFSAYLQRAILLILLPILICTGFSIPVRAVSDPQELTSQACLIYNLETDSILYGREIDTSVYPTALVKMTGAMLALEYYADDLDRELTVPAEALSGVFGNTINLVEGEVITVRNLLYATLISGANDAMSVLAYSIAGNVTAFVNMMNQKVQEL